MDKFKQANVRSSLSISSKSTAAATFKLIDIRSTPLTPTPASAAAYADCCPDLTTSALSICTAEDNCCKTPVCYVQAGVCVQQPQNRAVPLPPLACFTTRTVTKSTTPRPPPPLVYTNQCMEYRSEKTIKQQPQYVYEEPEENFISIDDAKVKGFLVQIGLEQQKLQQAKKTQTAAAAGVTKKNVVYEIIDLDDEEQKMKLHALKRKMPNVVATTAAEVSQNKRSSSASISLVPAKSLGRKDTNTVQLPKIIAEIDLLDSSDSEAEEPATTQENVDDDEETEDDEKLPFAATAVSCELELVDVESTTDVNEDVVLFPSDDDNMDLAEESDKCENVTSWNGINGSRSHLYQCLLCGKKVQSNYNLRRHMMIHTGERPFACDMCDRRFREFSDLKKHRRRHANEPNFTCMICHKLSPSEQDPTRCVECESKNLVLKPQGTATAATTAAATHSRQVTENASQPALKIQPIRQKTASKPPVLVQFPVKLAKEDVPETEKLNVENELSISDTLLLLDSIPAVHRPSTTQFGLTTRKEFPCPLCQRAFGTRHNLKRHFMIHTGEKPFSCNHCRKPFREYSTLKKHMVTHQRERWYKCLRCTQKFRDYLDYTKHKRTHPDLDQSDDSSKPDQIRWWKTRNNRRSSKEYNSEGSDEDDYDNNSFEDSLECCECNQTFTDIVLYTEHLRLHEDTVLIGYECSICDDTLDDRDTLKDHMALKHASKH